MISIAIIDVYAERLRGFDGLETIDKVLLLWLYANPHGTYSRSENSLEAQIRRILLAGMREDSRAQIDRRTVEVLDSSLSRLQAEGLVDLFFQEDVLAKVKLSNSGRLRIEKGLSAIDLQRIRQLGETR